MSVIIGDLPRVQDLQAVYEDPHRAVEFFDSIATKMRFSNSQVKGACQRLLASSIKTLNFAKVGTSIYTALVHLAVHGEHVFAQKLGKKVTKFPGKELFMQALKEGNEEFALKLLKHNLVDVESIRNEALDKAFMFRRLTIIQALLPANIDEKTLNKYLRLYGKAEPDDVQLQLFFAYGSNTILYDAIRTGNETLALRLMSLNGAPWKIDRQLLSAAIKNNRPRIVEAILNANPQLISVPLSVEVSDIPLLEAAASGLDDENCIRILSQGIGLPTKNAALLKAVLLKKPNAINALIACGADVNFKDKDGNSLLMIAAKHGFLKGIEILTRHQADIYAKNQQGDTALMLAVNYNRVPCVACLAKLGGEKYLSVKNLEGLTAFSNIFTSDAISKQQKIALFAALLDKPEDFAEVFLEELELINIISNQNSIANTAEYSFYEGSTYQRMATAIAESLQTLPREYVQESDLPKVDQLAKAFKRASEATQLKDAGALADSINKNEIVIMPLGWLGHGIYLVFGNGFWGVCNRGDESFEFSTGEIQSIAMFQRNTSLIDKADIERLILLRDKPSEEATKFIFEKFTEKYAVKHTVKDGKPIRSPLCKETEESLTAKAEQQTGNCAYASGKEAVPLAYALMGVERRQDGQPTISGTHLEKAYNTKKYVSAHGRALYLERYLKRHPLALQILPAGQLAAQDPHFRPDLVIKVLDKVIKHLIKARKTNPKIDDRFIVEHYESVVGLAMRSDYLSSEAFEAFREAFPKAVSYYSALKTGQKIDELEEPEDDFSITP